MNFHCTNLTTLVDMTYAPAGPHDQQVELTAAYDHRTPKR